ncbi:restriction endonuclease subunit S [Citrobacter portucalensis]
MAKYKAYPEYKDSGIEWLKAIPEQWKLSKLRYQFVFGKGLTITKEHLQDEGIPCVNYGEVHSKYGFEVDPEIHTLKCVSDKYLKDNSSSLLAKGDIVFADTSEDIDGSGNFTQLVTDSVTFAGYHTIIARPFERENSRFYAYLLDCKELRSQVRHAVKGVKVFSITQAILRNLSIWLPSKDEQAKIAAFLDHETAKIDNLIEKQQQLIELLKEKRQAVISHAVTKGLNPDVPMKDSGVEWLGEVPEHWTISTLKHHAKFIDGDRGSEYPNDNDLVDDGVVFLSSKNISNWEINIDDANYISREKFSRLNRGKTINGDVIVKVRGSTGRIGELAIFETERLNKSTAFINAQMMIIRLKNSFNNRFLCNVAQGHYWMEQLNVGAYGTAQQQLNNAIFSGMIMVVPPIDEQLTINKFLELEIKRFDGLIKNTSNMIQLIQERRTALISAAVTGKIDVRDWVAPDMQDIEEPQEAIA